MCEWLYGLAGASGVGAMCVAVAGEMCGVCKKERMRK